MNIEMTFSNQINEEYDKYEEYYYNLSKIIFNYLDIKDDVIFDVSLVSLSNIHSINLEYRNVDRPTDVISFAFEDNMTFPNKGMPRTLGEIIISPEKAMMQSEEYGHSFTREMAFLFTHGLLHLLGYDHMNEDDEKEMFGIQNEIMKIMKL